MIPGAVGLSVWEKGCSLEQVVNGLLTEKLRCLWWGRARRVMATNGWQQQGYGRPGL